MSRRILAALLLCLAVASPAMAVDSGDQPTPWWFRGLAFHAPFDDPATPLKLIRGSGALTFTRAHDATHTATYVHPGTGLVTVASADQLRIEAAGALIEGARTNICLQSATLGTTWSPTNITVGDDDAVSPDGGTNAELLTASAGNGTLIQDLGVIASAAKVFSVYLKRATGTGDIDLTLNGGTGWTTVAVTSSWARYSITATLADPDVGIRIVTSGDAVYAYGGQVEAAAFASSYIPTTAGAVTRNDDLLTFPTSGNLSSTLGSISLRVTPNGFPPPDEITLVGNPADFNSLCIHDGTKRLRYREGANGQYFDGVTMANGTTYRAAIAYTDDVGAALALDGTVQSGKTFNGDFAFEASVQIGGSTHAYLFGHIKDLRIWNRAFTDAEMQNITR